MPYKFETLKLKIPKQYNRTRKLLDWEREEIKSLYGSISQRKLAKMYSVSRRLIQFIGCPEKYEKSKAIRRTRHKLYYDKDKQRVYAKNVRDYKKILYKNKILEVVENEMLRL